jgi:hypothetical protein
MKRIGITGGNMLKTGIIPVLVILLFMLTSACSKSGGQKSMLIGQIKKMSDMTLVEVKFKKYLVFKQDRKILFFNLKTATQAMCIYPRIELGVNLQQITEKDIVVDEDSRHIRLELPPLAVKKFEYDEKPSKNSNTMKKTTGKFYRH